MLDAETLQLQRLKEVERRWAAEIERHEIEEARRVLKSGETAAPRPVPAQILRGHWASIENILNFCSMRRRDGEGFYSS